MKTQELRVNEPWSEDSLPQRFLPKREVHVWRFDLDVSDLVLRRFRETLSEEELARANRFRFPHLRRRFVAGRGVLRIILADYLSIEPQRVPFSYGPHGKPAVADPNGNIEFNVSHSHDLMVAAVCREWPIGVDIEKEDAQFQAISIAERFFCERERDEIARKPQAEALRAFFQLWTAKEAVLKATALGLTLELSNLEIGLMPLRILALKGGGEIPRVSWYLKAFTPADGYSGALALGAKPSRLEYRDLLLPGNF